MAWTVMSCLSGGYAGALVGSLIVLLASGPQSQKHALQP